MEKKHKTPHRYSAEFKIRAIFGYAQAPSRL